MQMIRRYLVWHTKRFVRVHCKNGLMHAISRQKLRRRYALKKADGNGNANDIFADKSQGTLFGCNTQI